jgi:hypothetical protein
LKLLFDVKKAGSYLIIQGDNLQLRYRHHSAEKHVMPCLQLMMNLQKSCSKNPADKQGLNFSAKD